MDARESNDDWMDARIRMAQDDSDRTHAECFTEMFKQIANVAAVQLKSYGMDIADKDVVDWLEGVRDDLMDNLLWQEWGNASDLIPSDRRAHCEQVWRNAKERV